MAQNDTLFVIYSSDDHYVQHMGVSIYSLLEHNQDFRKIYIYIIENEILEENKKKLQKLVDFFGNAELLWIDFTNWKERIQLDMEWNISVSSYARLFISGMIPETINRILYLDCDMLICDSLKELWNVNLTGNIIGAVQDAVSDETKEAVGVVPIKKYFNAGMLLIDLENWRKFEIEKMSLEFISSHEGRVKHHDQGVLNGVLNDKWMTLPLCYNVMTIHFIYGRNKLLKYSKEHADFYTEEEIQRSKENPVVLHFTPSFTTRPWVENCNHPLREKYWNILQKTPWKNSKAQKDNRKWYVRLIEWRYRCLPF